MGWAETAEPLTCTVLMDQCYSVMLEGVIDESSVSCLNIVENTCMTTNCEQVGVGDQVFVKPRPR